MSKRMFKVSAILTVTHSELIEANSPEEAEAIYEDEVVPTLDSDLEEFNGIVEEAEEIFAEPVDLVDGEIVPEESE